MSKSYRAALLVPLLAVAACSRAASPAAVAGASSQPQEPQAPGGIAAVSTLFTGTGADRLVVSFATGGARLTPEAEAQLDTAARTYRDGHPIVMYVAGFTDRQGNELGNLIVAARRAQVVKAGLIARGIPADRLETAALGEVNPAVPTPPGVPEPANRRVIITWK